MALSVGIVGLPNAGKSTLFNALTRAGAQVGNYPFTTIEPNTGVVPVPDARLERLAAIFSPPRVIPTTVTFTDIAGLVRGASRGEGLGNQFLGHIRECDAIVLVARGFEDPDVATSRVPSTPPRDLEVVELELQLADLETLTRRLDEARRPPVARRRRPPRRSTPCGRAHDHLDPERPVRTLSPTEEERGHLSPTSSCSPRSRSSWSSTSTRPTPVSPSSRGLASLARDHGGDALAISARIEAEIVELPAADRREFLDSLGLPEPGLDRLAREAYSLLDLVTFFTAGEKEVPRLDAAARGHGA